MEDKESTLSTIVFHIEYTEADLMLFIRIREVDQEYIRLRAVCFAPGAIDRYHETLLDEYVPLVIVFLIPDITLICTRL